MYASTRYLIHGTLYLMDRTIQRVNTMRRQTRHGPHESPSARFWYSMTNSSSLKYARYIYINTRLGHSHPSPRRAKHVQWGPQIHHFLHRYTRVYLTQPPRFSRLNATLTTLNPLSSPNSLISRTFLSSFSPAGKSRKDGTPRTVFQRIHALCVETCGVVAFPSATRCLPERSLAALPTE